MYDHEKLSLSPGGTVIDVGANIGLFSLWIANFKLKEGTIHAFEPSPHIFNLLIKNAPLGTTDGNQIITHQQGLLDKDGVLPMTTYLYGSSLSTLYPDEDLLSANGWVQIKSFLVKVFGPAMGNFLIPVFWVLHPLTVYLFKRFSVITPVPVRTLSGFMKENSIEKVDLLKIDVQRSEYNVLLGIEDEDWQKINAVVMEVEKNHEAIHDLLRKHGFHVEVVNDPMLKGTPNRNVWGLRP